MQQSNKHIHYIAKPQQNTQQKATGTQKHKHIKEFVMNIKKAATQQNTQQHATSLLHDSETAQQSTLSAQYYKEIINMLNCLGFNDKLFSVIDPELDNKLFSGELNMSKKEDKEQYLLFCKEFYKQIDLSKIMDEANLYLKLDRQEELKNLCKKIKRK